MIIALWIVLLVCIVWIALGEMPAGWDGHLPLPYLIALIPFMWIPTLTISIAGFALHEIALGCTALAVCLASLLRKEQYWINNLQTHNTAQMIADRLAEKRETSRENNTEETEAGAEDARHGQFRVMTLNCRFGRANAAAIVEAVKRYDIAVLALQELTENLIAELDAAGLADLLPYRQLGEVKESDNGGFNGVWIRVEPSDASPVTVVIPAADVPGLCFPIDSMRSITFASAHPKSPMRGCRDWSAGIIGLGAFATTQNQGDITVVMGDLNSGTDHPSFRKLMRLGFKDAALVEAKGRRATFPSWLPWPRIILDHVLFTSGLDASDVRSFTVEGSDHLALAATLTLK
ncbi:endonuclease/exonuclease/phosphatase family protein [Bifidobacterium dentium]|uniref:endonuclease/exonuclease/phosphatase family protein n=1 Tax=Bifidobacterium dentium TaxID=1689 RepID=UPI0018C202F7|nr:endonuclease/exonuclease/phosphatase family protein [Bifidobacterium dentium]MBF9695519.1 endonuclease/exonuclease/phosphatase family protein [Bifidobacterium dentium]MBF9711680.1 endonuclease/exonuclease/phosphatase family protein [Bifidobacterium dentium]MBF9713641.1 endonuclease/exonuclease/phosphatase family protein [Bifidobacterium dentium]MBF9717611.1 endonuclease/exonuclease/phosphatase family protein [Bifidobacterium dentium]